MSSGEGSKSSEWCSELEGLCLVFDCWCVFDDENVGMS